MRAENGGYRGTVFLMESLSRPLVRADVVRSVPDHAGFARSEVRSSSADHRPSRRPGLATKVDHLDAAVAAVETAGEAMPASPVLTTKFDHIRESSLVISVHTLEGPSARFASSATCQDGSMHP